MNAVIKNFIIILYFISFVSFSQTKKDDAYFILDNNNKEYTLGNRNYTDKSYESFPIYNRKEYEKREKKIAEEKKNGTYYRLDYYGNEIPKTLSFRKVHGSKTETINHCDIHFLNLVDYKWIRDNSWKENNPNILFKDLYFLLKIDKNKYLKFKVERTVIAY
ncbi:hypothetical protein ACQY1Q_17280 [Tenacibaculum sp. TC6]|uniref:hypothetical protein n=1 Tax=Tenacibaculum sp. TC6 TaxID=3423223 RepID=UPI003D362F20